MEDGLWDRVRGKLKSYLPAHVYHSLVETTPFEGQAPDCLEIRFRDHFAKESFEQKCLPALSEVLKDFQLPQTRIALSVNLPPDTSVDDSFSFQFKNGSPFNGQHTFETFVIGTSNQFAHAACMAVSKQPGFCYNPLFIFGGATIHGLALAMIIGIIVGTYSSIYIAGSLAVAFGLNRSHLLPAQKRFVDDSP